MSFLRRAALRALSIPSTSALHVARPRAFVTFQSSSLSRTTPSALLRVQRRWASEDAQKETEAEGKPLSNMPGAKIITLVKALEAETTATSEAERAIEEAGATQAAEQVASVAEVDAADPLAPPRKPGFKPEEPNNVLYIGNLYFDVTGEDLEREFSKHGDVLQTRIVRDSRGLSKGFGYVTFANIEQAQTAIENLNQQIFEGRRMAVQFKRDRQFVPRSYTRPVALSGNAQSRTLFIGNMSFEMTDQDLNELFRDTRNVIDVRVAIDRRTGQPRGFAHADFIDIPSAVKAKKLLENKEVYGRKLRVDYSVSRRDHNSNNEAEPVTTEGKEDGERTGH